LTLPLATAFGLADTPGTVAGFGPVDAPLARHLTGLAATHPATRCCLTLTDIEGHAAGHGCLPGPGALASLTTRTLTLTIHPLAQDTCDHRHQEPGYQPSRKLQHLITARAPPAPPPAAGTPPPAATWTTPPRMTTAAGPANATWPPCAATTTAANNPKAGT
jgi:hypothetical protein